MNDDDRLGQRLFGDDSSGFGGAHGVAMFLLACLVFLAGEGWTYPIRHRRRKEPV